MKFINLEKLLPFGYLILVVLGILKESVFYYQIGLNILKYSNLMDVLISPIAELTSQPVVLFPFLAYIIAAFLWYSYLAKHPENKYAKSFLQTKNLKTVLSPEQLKIRAGNQFLGFAAFAMVCFFLGIGLGSGRSVARKITNNKIKYDTIITFNTGERQRVYLIGSNSANYFYVIKENKNIHITPVIAVKAVELKRR